MLEVLFIFIPAEKSISKTFTQLEESQENLQELFETAPAAMLLVNEDDLNIILRNKYAKEMIGELDFNIDVLSLDKIFDCDLNNYSDLIDKIRFNEKIENYESIIFNDYDDDTIEDYIRHSDHLMYENKKSKKMSVRI